MQKRIRTVLIISSNYDFFMLEEDGRIDEQIFNEYVSLNLRYPPTFVKATNAAEAFRIMKEGDIDLVIEMLTLSWLIRQQPQPKEVVIRTEPQPVEDPGEPVFPLRPRTIPQRARSSA